MQNGFNVVIINVGQIHFIYAQKQSILWRKVHCKIVIYTLWKMIVHLIKIVHTFLSIIFLSLICVQLFIITQLDHLKLNWVRFYRQSKGLNICHIIWLLHTLIFKLEGELVCKSLRVWEWEWAYFLVWKSIIQNNYSTY